MRPVFPAEFLVFSEKAHSVEPVTFYLEPPSRVPCVPRAPDTPSETHRNTCPANQRVPWSALDFVSLAFQKSCFLTITRKSGRRFGVFLVV